MYFIFYFEDGKWLHEQTVSGETHAAAYANRLSLQLQTITLVTVENRNHIVYIYANGNPLVPGGRLWTR